MTFRKAIFLNGPPRSGKDSITKELIDILCGDGANCIAPFDIIHEKFSKPLKEGVQAIFNLDESIEKTKDDVDDRLLGSTYRRQQIDLFQHLQRIFGSVVLGRMFDVRVSRLSGPSLFIVSDTGRFDEVFPAIKSFDPTQCALFRIHRAGCDFSNDIRQYVVDSEVYGVKAFDVDNNGTVTQCALNILSILEDVWGKQWLAPIQR